LPVQVQGRHLEIIRDEIEQYGLFTVYSAPIELWNDNRQLNSEGLTGIFKEGISLGANWIKVSLGHYHQEESDVVELNNFVNQHPEFELLVENDQTLYGGNVSQLKSFFESIVDLNVPVKMTFDAGNWYYTGQDVEDALNKLAPYVSYLHLKQVEKQNRKLVTVPLQKEGRDCWKKVIKSFPVEMMKAL
jgi:sugar phosphate isomerase/epimerase